MAMQRKLQVFVSSTYNDLIFERQAAVESILRAGHIPAGMELFAAGSESQLDIIRRWIDGSDIYMLLLGGRYGSIEPNSGLSYTEIEYRYAMEQNKPIFAVILSDTFIQEKVKDKGTSIVELAERNKLASFEELVKKKISRYANDKSEIRLSVLESMLDIQSRYTLKGWVREDQIPDVSELINQITELKDKNRELEGQLKVYDSAITNKIGEFSFEEIKNALQKVLINVPVKVTNGDALTTNVYDLLLMYQRKLSLGVDNKQSSSSLDIFLYFSVCSHLRIYELTEIVKMPNVQWTKFQTSKLGNKFISTANIKRQRSKLIQKDGVLILKPTVADKPAN